MKTMGLQIGLNPPMELKRTNYNALESDLGLGWLGP